MAPTDRPQDGQNPPQDDRISKDLDEGPSPDPAGSIDTGDSAVPPYDGRSRGGEHEGTARAMGSEPPLKDPPPPASNSPRDDAHMAPKDVGESLTRRGEDVTKENGKEAGRFETGNDESSTDRPTGESTGRDATGVDHQQKEKP